MKCINIWLVIVSLLLLQTPASQSRMPNKGLYQKLAAEMETTLHKDVLDVWFPRSIDKENGGFYSNFTRDWQRTTSEGKFSVFQGRMVWVASQIVRQRPEFRDQFLPIIEHGMKYLADVLWDRQYGGFFWGLDDKGHVSPRYTDGKHLYG